MTFQQRFIDIALDFQGCHYIWGGKGHLVFRDGKLTKHQFTDIVDQSQKLLVFDCSGLVTVALWMASGGKIDLRGSHSASTIWHTFPETKELGEGTLLLYPNHVSIDLGRGLVLDAHGGNQKTLTPLDAQLVGAKVEVHRINRPDSSLLGLRKLPLDMSELEK